MSRKGRPGMLGEKTQDGEQQEGAEDRGQRHPIREGGGSREGSGIPRLVYFNHSLDSLADVIARRFQQVVALDAVRSTCDRDDGRLLVGAFVVRRLRRAAAVEKLRHLLCLPTRANDKQRSEAFRCPYESGDRKSLKAAHFDARPENGNETSAAVASWASAAGLLPHPSPPLPFARLNANPSPSGTLPLLRSISTFHLPIHYLTSQPTPQESLPSTWRRKDRQGSRGGEGTSLTSSVADEMMIRSSGRCFWICTPDDDDGARVCSVRARDHMVACPALSFPQGDRKFGNARTIDGREDTRVEDRREARKVVGAETGSGGEEGGVRGQLGLEGDERLGG